MSEAALPSAAAPPRAAGSRRAVLIGAALMALSSLCITLLDATLKQLATHHDAMVLAFWRNLGQVLLISALAPALGARRVFKTHHLPLQMARGACLIGTTLFIVVSVRVMPLIDAYSLTLSAPIFAAILSMLLLKERATPLQWLGMLIGFAGILIALQPGLASFGLVMLFPLAMAFCNGLYHVLTRRTARHDGLIPQMVHPALWACVIAALTLPFRWEPVAAGDLALLALAGGLGAAGHFFLAGALKRAPAPVISPMLYSQIIWATLVGFLVFGESPGPMTILGCLVVAAGGILVIRGAGTAQKTPNPHGA